MPRNLANDLPGSDRPPPYNPTQSGQYLPNQTTSHQSGPDIPLHMRCGENQALLGPQNYGGVKQCNIRTRIQRLEQSPGIMFFLVCFIVMGAILGYMAHVPLNLALHDRLQHQWANEVKRWEIAREAWEVEARRHVEQKRRFEEEQQEMERQERKQREEEDRMRNSITWTGLEPGSCLRYGMKEYIATLSRVPLGFDSIEECQKKPIGIHGRQWYPSRCEDQGICGRVTGHWEVDINEPSCTPWWSYFKDKGCVEFGIRRHEAPLENLRDTTTNWENICSTTPATIGGRHYDGPTSCVSWGKYGIWGIWLVEDESCR